MSARQTSGKGPCYRLSDILSGGTLALWRNPAGKPFGDDDAWTLTVDWTTTKELPDAYARLAEDEARLAASHAFAWNADFGYLSPDPLHCGTALCVDGEFHLEALHLIGDLPPVLNALEAVRFGTSSILEDGVRQAAHLFRVRNIATLGVTEQDLLARARRLFDDLARQEYNARKALVEDSPRILADAVARALAILRSARLLAPGELLDLLSPIRLAASMGFLDGLARAETLQMMREQIDAPELPPPRTAEDDRVRDARDARLADRINARFATVHFNSLAEKWLN